VSLKAAREKREEARQQLPKGLNPRVVKNNVREARSVLFGGIADEWIKMMSTPGEFNSEGGVTRTVLDPATVKKHRWVVDNYLNPAFGNRPIAQISAQDFLPLLKDIEEQGKSETAHNARALASRIFCYAHATGRAPQGDVTVSLKDALAPAVVVHHATITDPEKVGELLLASKQALVSLYDLKKVATENARFMFPVLGSKEGVMSENTINLALRTLGYAGNLMTAHGFRSMASTLLNEQQLWHPDAIEQQLAHAPRNKIRAAYNYAEHLPERAKI